MELGLFDEVGEVLRRLVPPELGVLRCKHHRYGIKVWFGPVKATREHYEAQVIGAQHVAEATVLAIEVKSGRAPDAFSGLDAFAKAFKPTRTLLVGGDGIPIDEFLANPVEHWLQP